MPSSNTFELTCAQISAITYRQGSFVITQGEDYSLPPTFERDAKNPSTWIFEVEADRSGSEFVADSFKNITGGPAHEYADSFVDQSPEKLNFYFGVDVIFTINNAPIPVILYFGQGHNAFGNNWWIGGSTVYSNSGSNPVLVVQNASGGITYRIEAKTSEMTLIPA